ncbi:MAG: glycosyltransferase [Bacteroidota bacterium]|nr:glycosyltransferase [Bacteroidota bacterium]
MKFLNTTLQQNVKLVAFVSLRNFFDQKTKIKSDFPDAVVLPMFPGVKRWRKNIFLLRLLCKFKRPTTIIGRSVLATQLAVMIKNSGTIRNVVYDGRGAITAEWKEYGVINDPDMLREISELETEAVLLSDVRIAVSNKLVEYWRSEFNYTGDEHVVIPCTLNKVFTEVVISNEAVARSREKLGLMPDDVVFVYSGSVAGWQSFDLLYTFIAPMLRNGSNRILFLADKDKNIEKLSKEFPGKVICKKVSAKEVPQYLLAGDYGLLIREKSVTNKVASPVKFAEYLSCGLQVIISDELGDYSEFVAKNSCGSVHSGFVTAVKIGLDKKLENQKLAYKNFTKETFVEEYRRITNC